jgi:hypothetical protein
MIERMTLLPRKEETSVSDFPVSLSGESSRAAAYLINQLVVK